MKRGVCRLKFLIGLMKVVFRIVMGVGLFAGMVAIGIWGPFLSKSYPVLEDVVNYGLYGIAGFVGLVLVMLVITFVVVEPMNVMRERRERKREVEK